MSWALFLYLVQSVANSVLKDSLPTILSLGCCDQVVGPSLLCTSVSVLDACRFYILPQKLRQSLVVGARDCS